MCVPHRIELHCVCQLKSFVLMGVTLQPMLPALSWLPYQGPWICSYVNRNDLGKTLHAPGTFAKQVFCKRIIMLLYMY